MYIFNPTPFKLGMYYLDANGHPTPNYYVGALNSANFAFSELAVDVNAMRANLAQLKLLVDRLEQKVKQNDIKSAFRQASV